jgi:toxin-antitoxin system PIN domain toxin
MTLFIPDVNILMYAVSSAFREHPRAHAWWQEVLSHDVAIGLTPPTVFGFLRLSTSRRVLEPALAVSEASGFIDEWLVQPAVEYLRPGRRHLEVTLGLLAEVGVAGNLTTDAQIAAHALEFDAVVVTHDTDFGRFPGVRVFDPLL